MTARLAVKCKTKEVKEGKEGKEIIKEKDRKEFKELKEQKEKDRKEFKEWKEFKEGKEFKEKDKDLVEWRRPGERSRATQMGGLEERVANLEAVVQSLEPFITGDLRPDLRESALAAEPDCDEVQARMREGAAEAKRHFDTKVREV